jgi:hypothetical protein
MGLDTKISAGVGGGFSGKKQPNSSITFLTALLGNEGLGMTVSQKLNEVASVQRKEKTDQQRRRTQGYRGL